MGLNRNHRFLFEKKKQNSLQGKRVLSLELTISRFLFICSELTEEIECKKISI